MQVYNIQLDSITVHSYDNYALYTPLKGLYTLSVTTNTVTNIQIILFFLQIKLYYTVYYTYKVYN